MFRVHLQVARTHRVFRELPPVHVHGQEAHDIARHAAVLLHGEEEVGRAVQGWVLVVVLGKQLPQPVLLTLLEASPDDRRSEVTEDATRSVSFLLRDSIAQTVRVEVQGGGADDESGQSQLLRLEDQVGLQAVTADQVVVAYGWLWVVAVLFFA